MLRGRSAELAALDRVLSQARADHGGAVVICGEVGTGKTALLESVATAAGQSRLLRSAGVESEAELPYAGLQVALREVLGLAARLPDRQAQALLGAVDLADGSDGDRFLVGAATLTLLGELSEDGPVVVLVDDAHRLDLCTPKAAVAGTGQSARPGEAMAAAWDTPDPAAAAADTAARLSDVDVGDGALRRGAAGLFGVATGDFAGGIAALREFSGHVSATRQDRLLSDQSRLQGWEMLLGDYDTVHDQAVALDRECREQGAVGLLPMVLLRLARCRLFLGRHRDAYASAMEGLEIARDTGQHSYIAMHSGVLAVLAALDGDEQACREPVGRDLSLGIAPHATWYAYAQGLLDLGLGRYESALHRFAGVTTGANRHVVIALHSLPDLVEAAARPGRPDAARVACDRFEQWAASIRTPWAKAVTLRCRALLTRGDDAGPLYEAALDAHIGDGRPFERARTRLLHGEWLRRAKRRGAAREALASALESFERMCAGPWAHRARSELRAGGAGPAAASPGADPAARLTAQEMQVVRLAATGMSNRDIGAQLFISPRTVGYHLSNAYPKLGVTSRAALAGFDLARNPVF